VLYKGKNIAEVLDMTVEEAAKFFENTPQVHRKLQTLLDVGWATLNSARVQRSLAAERANA
jgi:excinuclease ABC subunit A